jgi:hypothetical protein
MATSYNPQAGKNALTGQGMSYQNPIGGGGSTSGSSGVTYYNKNGGSTSHSHSHNNGYVKQTPQGGVSVAPQDILQTNQNNARNLVKQNLDNAREANQRDGSSVISNTQKETSWWGKANEFVARYTTKPVFSFISKSGIDLTSSKQQGQFAPSLLGVGPFGFKPKAYTEFYGGVQSGVFTKVRDKPLTVGAEIGAGYVGGALFEGLSIGATTLSPALGTGVKAVGLVGGGVSTGLYGYGKIKEVSLEPDYTKKGNIIGGALVDTSAIGYGFAGGIKGGQKFSGYLSSIGRNEIPLVKLTKPEILSGEERFPTIPKSRQLGAFQTGSYGSYKQPVELTGGKQGAFHTTQFRFYGKDNIMPKSGTSELEGLYGSPYISPNFAKISGSGDMGIFPKIKALFEPSGKPGVALLKPKGFREVEYGISKSPVFEGQKPIGKGNFAFFKQPPKQGFADVPLMKTEAEAIFRPGAGSYKFESGKYYTKINDVRVPIDVFSYGGKGGTSTIGSISSSRGGYNLPKDFGYSGSSGLVSIPFISSIGKSGSYKSPNYSSPSSSGFSIPSSPLSNNISSYPSTPSKPIYPSVPSYPSTPSKPIYPSVPSYPSTPSYPSIMPPSYPSDKSMSGFSIPTKRKKGRKSPFDIAPSFTGIIANVKQKGTLKVSRNLGVTPFQIRGIKTGKGAYYKLTDL